MTTEAPGPRAPDPPDPAEETPLEEYVDDDPEAQNDVA